MVFFLIAPLLGLIGSATGFLTGATTDVSQTILKGTIFEEPAKIPGVAPLLGGVGITPGIALGKGGVGLANQVKDFFGTVSETAGVVKDFGGSVKDLGETVSDTAESVSESGTQIITTGADATTNLLNTFTESAAGISGSFIDASGGIRRITTGLGESVSQVVDSFTGLGELFKLPDALALPEGVTDLTLGASPIVVVGLVGAAVGGVLLLKRKKGAS